MSASSSACLRSRACPTSSPSGRARARAGSRPPSPNGRHCPVHSVTTWRSGTVRHATTAVVRPTTRIDLAECALERQETTVPYTLVLLRHGQSTWNLENLFTGWVDVDLTDEGATRRGRAAQDLRAGRRAARRRCTRRSRSARSAPPSSRWRECDRIVDPGAPVVAVERTALRRAPGQGTRRRRPSSTAPSR